MTDERIKEEFVMFAGQELSMATLAFGTDVGVLFPYYYEGAKHEAYGFYSGFRAAERLAKIEVLEELDKLITSTGSKVATMQKISAMLSDLKGEQ